VESVSSCSACHCCPYYKIKTLYSKSIGVFTIKSNSILNQSKTVIPRLRETLSVCLAHPAS
jgi:hypothetical protein